MQVADLTVSICIEVVEVGESLTLENGYHLDQNREKDEKQLKHTYYDFTYPVDKLTIELNVYGQASGEINIWQICDRRRWFAHITL